MVTQRNQLKHFLFFPVIFATLALIFFVLIVWQQLLLPLVMAIVIWYLIVTLANVTRKIPLIGNKLPNFLSYLFAFAFCFGAGWFVWAVITANIATLLQQLPAYQERFSHLSHSWLAYLGVANPPDVTKVVGKLDMMSVVTAVATLTRDIARNAGIIIVYVIFLLWEQHSFDTKLAALISDKQRLTSARNLIQEIGSQIQGYIRIKVLTSLLTAFFSYFVMVVVGVDFAAFWALLIFILNFIPFIGSVIATIFPCVLTLVQFDTISPFIIVTTCLISIQFFVGNILEPKLMGQAFNLSGLVIILSLAVWGQVWGIVGMFLCVPIMVMASIVLANFSSTRPIAILLSQRGKLKH